MLFLPPNQQRQSTEGKINVLNNNNNNTSELRRSTAAVYRTDRWRALSTARFRRAGRLATYS